MQKNPYVDEVTKILNDNYLPSSDDTEAKNSEDDIETIHIYIFKEPKQSVNVVDAVTPKVKTHPFMLVLALFIATLLPIFSILFQIFVLLNPPTATITLVPIQKELSWKGNILALPNPTSNEISSFKIRPVTFSQTITSPATGHGHQDAAFAKGTITFYNGSSTSRVIPEGTQLTGKDGVNVVTDETAFIPPATSSTPPTFGRVSVSAHAIFTGPTGNIQEGDINSYALGASILAQNTAPFTQGMDARDFSIITSSDIDNALSPLKVEVTHSVQTQLQLEVKEGQSLIPPSCSTNINSNQQAGDEASKVKVIFSESCKAMAYDTASLQKVGSEILMRLAQKQLGASYFPHLGIKISILNILVKDILQGKVSFNVKLQEAFFYQFSSMELEQIKQISAGKSVDMALEKIRKIPGLKEVSINFQGFGNEYYLPKNAVYIRTLISSTD